MEQPLPQTRPADILSFDLSDLIDSFSRLYGKGAFHAEAVFRQIHREGFLAMDRLEAFRRNPSLGSSVMQDFAIPDADISREQMEGDTVKFCMRLDDGLETESVVLKMQNYYTLCISTQIGCRQGCVFCETAQMGLVRNLTAGEIVRQFHTASFHYRKDIRNIVFMGMGEPLDNLDAVLKSIDILTNPKGRDLHHKHISISTSGYLEGLEDFGRRIAEDQGKLYQKLHLSVSLNAPNDELRNKLMPVNRKYPLQSLKTALLDLPHGKKKDALFFEYIVIPEVNNSREDAKTFSAFMDGLRAKVNIIPFNPGTRKLFRAPTDAEMEDFWRWIREEGRECRTRKSKGGDIMAACGQLGNPALRRA